MANVNVLEANEKNSSEVIIHQQESSDVAEKMQGRVMTGWELREGRFTDYWKQGVELVGVELFGDGTEKSLKNAINYTQLYPKKELFQKAFAGPLSPGQAAFMASMFSFYNRSSAVDFCKSAKIYSIGDLTKLDSNRTRIIVNLLVNYSGW